MYFHHQYVDDGKFRRIFPFVLFWTVTVTYFPDLARLVKISPKFLKDVNELIRQSYDIGYLRRSLEFKDSPDVLKNNYWLLEFSKQHLDRLMFRFLKAFECFNKDREGISEDEMRCVIEK